MNKIKAECINKIKKVCENTSKICTLILVISAKQFQVNENLEQMKHIAAKKKINPIDEEDYNKKLHKISVKNTVITDDIFKIDSRITELKKKIKVF